MIKEKQKHTPGPWMPSTRHGSSLVYGGIPNGDPVAEALGDNADANIFLIAAAPALLAAAKEVLREMRALRELAHEKGLILSARDSSVMTDLVDAVREAEGR